MSIKDLIFGNNKQSDFKEEDIVTLHDAMMAEYGWIPLEEFKNLPIPTLFLLINKIRERHEREEKQMNKGRKR